MLPPYRRTARHPHVRGVTVTEGKGM